MRQTFFSRRLAPTINRVRLAGIPAMGSVLVGLVASASWLAAPVAQAADAPTAIIEFALPTALANPSGIAAGPDGSLWFTEPGANQIGKITQAGVVTEYPIRTSGSDPLQIVAGPDGRLWFTEFSGGNIGAIAPDGSLVEYELPRPLRRPQGITAGPDGALWFTELSGFTPETWIGRITTAGEVTEYPIGSFNNPVGITVGPDGNVWATLIGSNGSDAILRITPAGVVTPFPLQASDPAAHVAPQGIAAGSDGNVWFTERNPAQIGAISPQGVMTHHPVPTPGSAPNGITTKHNGSVWFTETDGNKIGRLSATGRMVELPIPTPGSSPKGIAVAPDGSVWFTESDGNKIGSFQPRVRAALAYTGDTLIGQGRPARLSAVLTSGDNPLAGRAVTFTVGGGQACTGTTAATGAAECHISTVDRPGGQQTVVASFAGDAGYRPATVTSTVFVVTYSSLCDLSQQLVTNPGEATALCSVLRAAERDQQLGLPQAKAVHLKAYQQLVSVARMTQSVAPEQAALLISASDLL